MFVPERTRQRTKTRHNSYLSHNTSGVYDKGQENQTLYVRAVGWFTVTLLQDVVCVVDGEGMKINC